MDDIIKQANFALDLSEADKGLKMFKEAAPPVIKMLMILYKECKIQGFTDAQSFDFAKDYVIRSLLNNSGGAADGEN